ncbi:hypothetical protein [Muricoccus aerilatus]|uniref:hypothetical protein n=1 Tax=Muricoccus aerilatus TaxID=452982 RepID=UPI0012EB970C|nr:hypothetical protein [Roseomonas aerilata]
MSRKRRARTSRSSPVGGAEVGPHGLNLRLVAGAAGGRATFDAGGWTDGCTGDRGGGGDALRTGPATPN